MPSKSLLILCTFLLSGCIYKHIHTPTKTIDEIEENFMGEEIDIILEEDKEESPKTYAKEFKRAK